MAVSPDGDYLYATYYYGIKVIETKTQHIVQTISLGTIAPLQVLFNPNGHDAYALVFDGYARNKNEEELGGIIQINTQTLTTKHYLWHKLLKPITITIAPNGVDLYAVDQIEPLQKRTYDNIVTLDTVSHKKAGTVTLDPYQYGVPIASAITPDGQYLYFPTSSGELLTFDTATQAVETVSSVLPGAYNNVGIAIAPNGNYAYVADGDLYVFDISSN